MTDFEADAFARKAFYQLAAKAEPRVAAALKELGAKELSELPPAVAQEIFGKALIETAARHAPAADIGAMDQLFRSMSNPLYLPACKRAKAIRTGARRLPGSDRIGLRNRYGWARHPGCAFRETDGTRQGAAAIGAAQR
jgi:hypothetical protein